MRIAIAGAGVAGAYLYRLIQLTGGIEAAIFERATPHSTRCGLRPCAWAVTLDFLDLVRKAGLDPEKYILRRYDSVTIEGARSPFEAMAVDKPALIAALLGDAPVRRDALDLDDYDRVIDATGLTRAFLGPLPSDIIAPCVQYRVRFDGPVDCAMAGNQHGYSWRFPLSNGEYHVGCGSATARPKEIVEALGWLEGGETVCACASQIRMTGPRRSLPFVIDFVRDGRMRQDHIWGAGEAIGCVSPIMGEGIVPAMQSVTALLQNWQAPAAYPHAILRQFRWMNAEANALCRLIGAPRAGQRDALAIRKSAARLNMRLGLRRSLRLMERLSGRRPVRDADAAVAGARRPV